MKCFIAEVFRNFSYLLQNSKPGKGHNMHCMLILCNCRHIASTVTSTINEFCAIFQQFVTASANDCLTGFGA